MERPGAKRHIAALSELSGLFTEKLAEGGSVSFSPRGISMLPMLRAYGDEVTLKAPPARLKTGMVALFVSEREEGERKYILHRLVKIKGEELTFCGDRRRECDPPVKRDALIGVVNSYKSRGREHSVNELPYRLYSRWMVWTVPVRKASLALQERVYKLWKKLKKDR